MFAGIAGFVQHSCGVLRAARALVNTRQNRFNFPIRRSRQAWDRCVIIARRVGERPKCDTHYYCGGAEPAVIAEDKRLYARTALSRGLLAALLFGGARGSLRCAEGARNNCNRHIACAGLSLAVALTH
jgi:hypothetical protein